MILRHKGKDAEHGIKSDEWAAIAEALNEKKPLLVEKYGSVDGKSYRIWTEATIGGKTAIVGATVKNAGKNMEVNSIDTAFGASGAVPKVENVVYPKTEKEIQSVLTRHNSGRYTVSPSDKPKVSATGNKVSNAASKVNTPTFKRGERVFLKGAQSNQTVTFLKDNGDGTVNVQVRMPGANRYAPAKVEERTVTASEVSATGLKGTLTKGEKAALEKGKEAETAMRQNLTAEGIMREKPLAEEGNVDDSEKKSPESTIRPADFAMNDPARAKGAKRQKVDIAEELDPMNASLNPKALTDPDFVAWAKKKGRTLTTANRRAYDAEQVKAAIPLMRRVFPGLKITYHDTVQDPNDWHTAHPSGIQEARRTPTEDPIVSNIRERLRYGDKYNPNDAHHIAHSASKDEIALFHDLGNGDYVIISRVKATDENYAKLKDFKESLANADADTYSNLVKEAESLVGSNGILGNISSENRTRKGAVRSVAGSETDDRHGADNRQGSRDSTNLRLIIDRKSGETLGWFSSDPTAVLRDEDRIYLKRRRSSDTSWWAYSPRIFQTPLNAK